MKFLAAICLAAVSLLAALAGPGTAQAEDAVARVNPYEGDAARASEGRSLFNQYCSHCHAPNAISPDPPRDLRRLQRRYGERMSEVFHLTVTNGRPDKGMPNWTGVLDDQVLWTIFTFLESVQSPP